MEFEDPKDREKAVMEELKFHFKPEFLNRLDDIVIFNPLGLEQIKEIVDIMLIDLKNRLKERSIDINLTDNAKALLAKAGFDPTYGARPLKRTIYEFVEDKIAEMILEDKIHDGDTINIDEQNGEIIITVK